MHRQKYKSILNKSEDKIRKVLDNGGSYGDAARVVGVSRNSMIAWCRRNGIKSGHKASSSEKKEKKAERSIMIKKKFNFVANEIKQYYEEPEPELSVSSGEYPIPINDGAGVKFVEMKFNQCHRPLWGREEKIGNVCGRPTYKYYSYCRECKEMLVVKPDPNYRRKHVHGTKKQYDHSDGKID